MAEANSFHGYTSDKMRTRGKTQRSTGRDSCATDRPVEGVAVRQAEVSICGGRLCEEMPAPVPYERKGEWKNINTKYT